MSKACLITKTPIADIQRIMHTEYRCATDINILITAEEIQFTVYKLADRLNAHYCPKCNA